MARSQSHKKSGTPAASKSQELFASLRKSGLGRKIWAGLNHPATLQLFSVALMLWGLLTIATIAGVDTGAWGSAWARFLVLLFGWGAYPTGALITAVGLLLLRHIVHQPTVWRWRPFLGMELTLVGLLAITHTMMRTYGWALVESGRGGGLVGWAVSVFFSNAFGPLITNVLMSLVTFLGIALAFDVTTEIVRDFGKRLVDVWEAQRAMRRERRSQPPAAVVQQVSRGVMTSPIPGRETKPAHSEKPRVEKENLEQSKTSLDRKPATSQPRAQTAKPATKKPRSSDDNLPALGLLEKTKKLGIDNAEVIKKQEIIKETLAQFGVPVEMTKPRIGPTVTQFGVSPGYITKGNGDEHQRKVRVNQIASLADDLALALAAQSLRVEAPVPGRAVVGIEVPNDEIALVRLRSVLESVAFEKCGSPLCFAAGLDVAGEAIVADLAKMPHLLVAGTTGSGKSVFMKALAASLIMNNSPEDLRLVAIDPKIVELSHLNGLPHLLGQAVTELEQSLHVLRWVTLEMDNRYKLFAKTYARHLDDYNKKALRKKEETLPRIVVLIDELADLMMSAPDETERSLTRIAQMARATGIHLVVATQRPSTDVVTGLIKANFPARMSFATASSMDSRVILDTPGAESLLGKGDMLFLRPDASAPVRVQACYVSDGELEAIIQYWQKSYGATPAESPWKVIVETTGPEQWRIEGATEDADLLEQAIAYARKQGKISTSGIQRRLRISYPRAARLMEQMEEMGIVGPQESAGRKRHVILGGDE